eukprot:11044.XXX_535498_535770_1 [CDS] Oithona nana genome sequencing.
MYGAFRLVRLTLRCTIGRPLDDLGESGVHSSESSESIVATLSGATTEVVVAGLGGAIMMKTSCPSSVMILETLVMSTKPLSSRFSTSTLG